MVCGVEKDALGMHAAIVVVLVVDLVDVEVTVVVVEVAIAAVEMENVVGKSSRGIFGSLCAEFLINSSLLFCIFSRT